MYVCVCVYMCVFVCRHVYVHLCYVFMCGFMCVYLCTCVSVYVYMHAQVPVFTLLDQLKCFLIHGIFPTPTVRISLLLPYLFYRILHIIKIICLCVSSHNFGSPKHTDCVFFFLVNVSYPNTVHPTLTLCLAQICLNQNINVSV